MHNAFASVNVFVYKVVRLFSAHCVQLVIFFSHFWYLIWSVHVHVMF